MKFVKETTGQKRNLEIDIIRGIAMIFVLWGHSIQYCCVGYFDFFENFVFRFIYSFHMPLFIFISGYAFYWSCQKRYLRTILIKVIKGLGSSIIIWNTIQWIFSVILDLRKGNTLSIIGYVKWWISSLYGLWFLWSILIFSISVSLIYKKVNKLSIKLLLWFCVWITMVCLPDIIEPAKNCNIWLFPYFLSAFLFHEYQPMCTPPQEPHLHGVSTAPCRLNNRTETEENRSFPHSNKHAAMWKTIRFNRLSTYHSYF